jgi:nitroreductase
MISKINNKIFQLLDRASNNSSLIWHILTISQLRFKFSALRNGIQANRGKKQYLFNLRRNIHRLEKGLSYPNGKSIFAEDYILETVTGFVKGKLAGQLDEETIKWGEAVLGLYFETVKGTPIVEKARQHFTASLGPVSCSDYIPYNSSERPELNIDYNELLQLSVRRRSVRFFSEQTVDVSLINKAYEIAKYSPSACNRQAFQYLFYNDPNVVDKLAKVPGGVSGYSLPAVIVVVGRYDGYFNVRDINAPLIDASLSIMSFLLAAETLGLGTVCINWPNLVDREEKIRNIIHLDPAEFVIMMIGIGYPIESGKIPFSAKRPFDSIVSHNQRII